ncbi:serine/threonine-protein kinase Chk1-like [Oratosquilla oratoria]|uniref:serine/threonine-protein kinase Chk1-like n=1 Tax=Oratosquilla oratoria TaxID=337810 RepID=UPI003F76F064
MVFWLFSCVSGGRSPRTSSEEEQQTFKGNKKNKGNMFKTLWKRVRGRKSTSPISSDSSTLHEGTAGPLEARHYEKALYENEAAARDFETTSDWRTVRVLGKGTWGTVTLMRNVRTERLVARKNVYVVSTTGAIVTAEEVIHSQMRHKNVSRLFAWQINGNRRLLYVKYCARGDLLNVIGLYDLSDGEAQFYFKQLMSGVEYLHGRGVAHRDLKPANLLLTDDRTLKIGDFGSADIFVVDGREVLLSGQVGTFTYMAPEVIYTPESRYLGPPVDLWSCGIVLFNMLTIGCRPWSRAIPENEEYQQWVEKDPRLNELAKWKRLSQSSRALLEALLDPDPLQRLSAWRSLRQH